MAESKVVWNKLNILLVKLKKINSDNISDINFDEENSIYVLGKQHISNLVYESVPLQVIYGVFCVVIFSTFRYLKLKYRSYKYLLHALKHIEYDLCSHRIFRIFINVLKKDCFSTGNLTSISSNKILDNFLSTSSAIRTNNFYKSLSKYDCVRMRLPRIPDELDRQGNLIILKKHMGSEKGVLLIKYNLSIKYFPCLFDIARIVKDYIIILEPSWWGQQHERILSYIGNDADVYIQTQYVPDYRFIEKIDVNLTPVRIGPSDWTNPEIFNIYNEERVYDIVMIASWSAFKRHELLFSALQTIKNEIGTEYRVALIGYPWEWNIDKIRNLASRYHLNSNIDYFESIPHGDVAKIIASSRISVFLSKTEGSPKSLYESLFCNTPVLVYKYNRGIDIELITEKVGKTTTDEELSKNIVNMIANHTEYSPRKWALENTGYINTTRKLNQLLKTNEIIKNNPWTIDISYKMNSPHLRYPDKETREYFDIEYERLQEYIR